MTYNRYPAVGALVATMLVPAGIARAEEAQPASAWTHVADLGFVQTAGNTEVLTLSVGEKSSYKSDGWRAESIFALIYGRTDGVTTSEQWKAGLRVDRDLSKRVSLFALGGWERNEFAGVARRFEETLGFSFRVMDAEPTWLRFDTGLALIQERSTLDVENNRTAFRLADAFKQKLGGKAELTQDAELLMSLEDSEDVLLNAAAGVAAPVSDVLALKLSYQVRFDNQPEPGFKKTDRIFVAGLQLKF